MAQVFISYSSKDAGQAEEIVARLEAQGISCSFAPRDMQVGMDFAASIFDAIRNAAFFIPLISEAYQNSRSCFKELEVAVDERKNIIPLALSEIKLSSSMDFFLSNVQIQNYFRTPGAVLENVAILIKRSLPEAPHPTAAPQPEKTVMHQVFVSHSTIDDKIADQIVAQLEKAGVICWIAPRDTRSHTTFPAQITQAVRECPVFLLLVSNHSMESSHVEREISLAIDKKVCPGHKYIIPLMLSNCALTDEFCYYLANLHYYDYYKNPGEIMSKITEQILQFVSQEEASADEYLQIGREHYRKSQYIDAINWYKKAARLGNTDAQTNLGFCYHTGKGCRRNIPEAMKWYQMAADKGNAYAQANLGLCYAYESDVSRDWVKAVELFQKAAEQGHAGAQRHLGICYENGTGVPKNLKTAAEWYQKAADQGDEEAKKKQEKLR